MKNSAAKCALVVLVLFISPAHAQDKASIQRLMNESQLCSSFRIGVRDLAGVLGINLPSLLPNAVIGVDKNRHEVSTFDLNNTNARIGGKVGCQPSDAGVPFEPPFNLDPNNFRANDNFDCRAEISNRRVTSMNCAISGEVGKVLARYLDMNSQMTQILQTAVQ